MQYLVTGSTNLKDVVTSGTLLGALGGIAETIADIEGMFGTALAGLVKPQEPFRRQGEVFRITLKDIPATPST
jgi:hypothetical protein